MAAAIVCAAAHKARADNIVTDQTLPDAVQTLLADLPFGLQADSVHQSAAPTTIASPYELGDLLRTLAFSANPERSRNAGMYYTPKAIIDLIVDQAWKSINIPDACVCDPSMGSGWFFLNIIQRYAHENGLNAARAWASNALHGADIDPCAVLATRAALWLALSEPKAPWLPNPDHFVCADALLQADWSALPPCTAIIGNPPYEVLTNFKARPDARTYAAAIRSSKQYPLSTTGQINLYRCFIELGLRLLAHNGCMSFVVPQTFMRDRGSSPIRQSLLRCHKADTWFMYPEKEKLFPDATQSVCVFTAHNNAGRANRITVRSGPDTAFLTLAELETSTNGTLCIPEPDLRLLHITKALETVPTQPLSSIADIFVGDVDQTMYRTCITSQDTGVLLVRGVHMGPFFINLDPVPPKERFLDLTKFAKQKGQGFEQARIRTLQPRVFQLGIRNMSVPVRLVAAVAPPGVWPGNSINVYMPRAGVSIQYLAGLLNSSILNDQYRLISAGNNINICEMKSLRVPAEPSAAAIGRVERAYSAADRSALDAAVRECYGLPPHQ